MDSMDSIPAFYSCVDDTIEDAFDGSSDTEALDNDASEYHLDRNVPECRSSAMQSSSHLTSKLLRCSSDPETLFNENVTEPPQKTGTVLAATRNSSFDDSISQGNEFNDASLDWRLRKVGNASCLRLDDDRSSISTAVTDDIVTLHSKNIGYTDPEDNLLSKACRRETDIEQKSSKSLNPNLQSLVVDDCSENRTLDQSHSCQSELETKNSSLVVDSESEFQMRKELISRQKVRMGQFSDSVYLADDKVMEIVEEQLENDDEPTDGDEKDYSVGEKDSDNGEISDQEGETSEEDEVEEISEGEEFYDGDDDQDDIETLEVSGDDVDRDDKLNQDKEESIIQSFDISESDTTDVKVDETSPSGKKSEPQPSNDSSTPVEKKKRKKKSDHGENDEKKDGKTPKKKKVPTATLR